MLRVVAGFETISGPANAAMFANSVRKTLEHNELVYLQDDKVEALYYVESGHVRLSSLMEDGSAVIYHVLSSGQIFGELGVFDGGTHCDMATSLGRSVISVIPVRSFLAQSRNYPELSLALGRLIAHRYRAYVELTRILSLKSLSARLSQSILRLADALGTTSTINGRKVSAIGSIVTQSDLGLMARGARGNVNRALKDWEQKGLIAIRDREILLLDRNKLNALSFSDD
jgi:CRP-like cAMP-binding protein